MLRDFVLRHRFPTVQNSREQYFVTVAARRCWLLLLLAAAVVALCLLV